MISYYLFPLILVILIMSRWVDWLTSFFRAYRQQAPPIPGTMGESSGEDFTPFELRRGPSHRHRHPSRPGSRSGPSGAGFSQREELRRVAQSTLETLNRVLRKRRMEVEARRAERYSFASLQRLDPILCPGYASSAIISVTSEDTFNAALRLAGNNINSDSSPRRNRPLVVNFANDRKPGGGWRNGALAQEEALCYRSSLALSLEGQQYPLKMDEMLYTPYVLVIRDDMASGHELLPARDFTPVSVATVAAINKPQLRHFQQKWRPLVFASDRERSITKSKMRLVLRAAARHGHDELVLGALGCGVFANPPEDVAHCWLEVLQEVEFSGGWWREICFAVFDPNRQGNYETFVRVLDGKQVQGSAKDNVTGVHDAMGNQGGYYGPHVSRDENTRSRDAGKEGETHESNTSGVYEAYYVPREFNEDSMPMGHPEAPMGGDRGQRAVGTPPDIRMDDGGAP